MIIFSSKKELFKYKWLKAKLERARKNLKEAQQDLAMLQEEYIKLLTDPTNKRVECRGAIESVKIYIKETVRYGKEVKEEYETFYKKTQHLETHGKKVVSSVYTPKRF